MAEATVILEEASLIAEHAAQDPVGAAKFLEEMRAAAGGPELAPGGRGRGRGRGRGVGAAVAGPTQDIHTRNTEIYIHTYNVYIYILFIHTYTQQINMNIGTQHIYT